MQLTLTLISLFLVETSLTAPTDHASSNEEVVRMDRRYPEVSPHQASRTNVPSENQIKGDYTDENGIRCENPQPDSKPKVEKRRLPTYPFRYAHRFNNVTNSTGGNAGGKTRATLHQSKRTINPRG